MQKVDAQKHNNTPAGYQDMPENSFFKNPLVQALVPPAILVVLTSIIYAPSLYYPFQFDDIANISKRFGIRFDNPLMRWWNSPRWFGDWLNSINFQIGRFEPFYYRLFNLMIHILAGLCVFYLVKELCLYLRKNQFVHNNAQLIGFIASGLFLLHPVQTQTVSYVIQARLEGIASLAVLATLLIYVKLMQAKAPVAKVCYSALLFMAGMLSCGTKELVVVLPFLMLLVDWFFISEQRWDLFRKRFWVIAIFAVFFAVLVVHHMGMKFALDVVSFKATTGNNRGNILTTGAFDVITPWMYFISEFKVIVHYLSIFLWPFSMSVEYDWKIAQSFFNFDVIAPLLFLLLLFCLVVRAMLKKENTIFAFGMIWFILSIAPRTTIIPSPELVCDYKTYLASFGMMFMLAGLCAYIFNGLWNLAKNLPEHLRVQEFKYAAVACFMLLVGLSAYERNKVWETSVGFWEDNAKKAPRKARVHNNLGVALSEAGRIDESIVAYKKAIDLDGYYADPLSNLAVAYSLKNDVDKAIDALKSAIHICPNYPEAYNNLGTLLLQKKQYDDAKRMLEMAIHLRPYYGKAYYNMARMYEEKGEHEQAWDYLKKAAEGDLDTPEVFFKLGQMSLRVQKYQDAADAFELTLKCGVQQDQVYFNLANAYYMMEKYDKAQEIYERLVQKDPLDARYAYNLAETYFIKKDYQRAFDMFRKTTSLPQPIAQAFFRTVHCLENLKRTDDAKNYLNDLLTLNAADDFKTMAKNELLRIEMQEKVAARGGNSIGINEMNTLIAKHNGVELKKTEGKKKKEQGA